MNEEWFPNKNAWVENIKKELPTNFHELRKVGEDENFICKLIRDDNIKDFIVYVNKNNIQLNTPIKLSIFETNAFLIKKQNESQNKGITLTEYAAFFGSIQIIKYLQMEGEKLTPSLWLYAIHS